jgi:hypothetical protein
MNREAPRPAGLLRHHEVIDLTAEDRDRLERPEVADPNRGPNNEDNGHYEEEIPEHLQRHMKNIADHLENGDDDLINPVGEYMDDIEEIDAAVAAVLDQIDADNANVERLNDAARVMRYFDENERRNGTVLDRVEGPLHQMEVKRRRRGDRDAAIPNHNPRDNHVDNNAGSANAAVLDNPPALDKEPIDPRDFMADGLDENDVDDPYLAGIIMEQFAAQARGRADPPGHPLQPFEQQNQADLKDLVPELETNVECISKVRGVFPDVCPDYLETLYGSVAQSSDRLIAHILERMDNGVEYTKAKESRKRKRDVAEDEDEEVARKYSSADRLVLHNRSNM